MAISNHRIVKVENGQVTFEFVKICNFGLLSNRHRAKDIALCRRLITALTGKVHPRVKLLSTKDLILKLTGIDIGICPHCNKGHMESRQLLIIRQPIPT